MTNNVTLKDIYEAVDRLETKMTGAINSLDIRTDGLKDRIAAIELSQARKDSVLRENQAVLSTKFVIIGAIGMSLLSAFLYGLFFRIFTK